MSDAERLLELTIEYAEAKADRRPELEAMPGRPVGREPAEVAAEYAVTLRRLLQPAAV